LKFEISKKAEDQQQIPALRQAGCATDPISDLKFEISKKAEDQQQIPALRQAGCAPDPISDLKFEISKKGGRSTADPSRDGTQRCAGPGSAAP